jgi:penicillin-binding protein 2
MQWENSSYIIRKKVQQSFTNLRYAFIVPVIILYLVLIYLQVFKGNYFYILAEKNRSRTFLKFAPRGIIYDCNNKILADNRIWVRVYYYPFADKQIKTVQKIVDILPESKKLLFTAIKNQQVVSLGENIPREKLFQLLSLRHRVNGISIDTEYRRKYPYKECFAHLIGYVSELSQKEFLKLKSQGYYRTDLIGKSGVEKTYENYLRGEHGALVMEIDAHGVQTKMLRDLPPLPGNNLHLTIDTDLQLVAYNALAKTGKNGAVVGIDPRNGAVKIFVSYKSFDPNIFVTEIEQRKNFLNDKDIPLFNRCFQGTYSPGSTYKCLGMISALNENRVSKSWTVFCPGYFNFGNKIFKCWEKKGHQNMDMFNALKNSCNVYFANLALKIGIDNFEKYSKMFGFGELTKIDLPFETTGVCPSKKWKEENLKDQWYDGDTVNIGIGQGYVTATPLQLAVYVAAIANKGTVYQPFVVEKITDPNNNVIYKKEPVKKNVIKLNPEVWDFVEKSMIEVVRSGTGRAAFINNDIVLAGKTGTAQNPHGDDHALFICYGPIKENEIPPLALAIVVEHGKKGGAVAAPIAKEIFKEYLKITSQDNTQGLGDNYETD